MVVDRVIEVVYYWCMDEHKVIQLLLSNQEQLQKIVQTMTTKEELNEVKGMLADLATMTKGISEEHMFSVEWLKRLQTQIELHGSDIDKIKLQLNLA